MVYKPAASSESTTKDLKFLSDGQYRKSVQSVDGSEVKIQKIGVIDQIDGLIDESSTH